MNSARMTLDQVQNEKENLEKLKRQCNEHEQNMKNIIQSMYKIGNVGFGYKRMQKEIKAVKVLCLALDPLIPASVTYHVSPLAAKV